MRRIALMLALLWGMSLCAQSLVVTLKDGSKQRVTVNNIDRITFQDPEAEPTFDIKAEILSPYSAKVSYTPKNYKGNYLFFVVEAKTLDPYIEENRLDEWIRGDFDYLLEMADHNGMTIDQLLKAYRNAYCMDGQAITVTYNDLKYDSGYYAYCYGMSLDGEMTTEFFCEPFYTELVNSSDLTFAATVSDISETRAKIQVTPSNNEDSYFWTYVSEMDWQQYDIMFIMNTMIQNVLYEVQSGTDIFSIIHKGPSSEDVRGLWAGTPYHIVAWGMDDHGTPTTDPVEVTSFTTATQAPTSDCTFDLDCPQIKDNDIQLHVIPSDNTVRYYCAFIEESKCVGYGNDQMAQRIINMETDRMAQGYYGQGVNWGNAEWLLTGEQTVWGREDLDWTFDPEHNYQIYVFGVDDNGVRTTAVSRIDQETAAAERSNMTITMELIDATWDYGTFRFTPSNNDEYYIPFLVADEELAWVTNADGSLMTGMIVEEMIHYYDDTPNYYTMRGVQERKFRWTSDTDYTMLACGWSGTNTTELFQCKAHTPAIPFGESQADVEVAYELFDATALAEIDYERWKDYLGYVVINLTFTPNEHADFYCGSVWMPVSNYADTGGVDHLLTLITNPDVSIVNRPTAMYRTLTYNETYSLSYVAKDAEGRLGPWHYVEFTPQAGINISEPRDFWTRTNAPAMTLAISPTGEVKTIDSQRLAPRNM